MAPEPISVLFVCLGNICRSPMGEGVFRSVVSQPPYRDLVKHVDSCGTGAWHTGEDPDSRTMSTLEDHGITDYRHAARKIRQSDFDDFDYIFAMDSSNLSDIKRLARNRSESKAKIMMFGEYSGSGRTEQVEDPYYGARDGFEIAYEQCQRFTKNFLESVFPGVSK